MPQNTATPAYAPIRALDTRPWGANPLEIDRVKRPGMASCVHRIDYKNVKQRDRIAEKYPLSRYSGTDQKKLRPPAKGRSRAQPALQVELLKRRSPGTHPVGGSRAESAKKSAASSAGTIRSNPRPIHTSSATFFGRDVVPTSQLSRQVELICNQHLAANFNIMNILAQRVFRSLFKIKILAA